MSFHLQYEPIIEPGSEKFIQKIVLNHCRYNMSKLIQEGRCYDSDGFGAHFDPAYYCYDRWLIDWAIGGNVIYKC